ncbi:hypothetical protein D6810_01330 [Candidatus Dojkabacteria bacterium]|uniref:WD40 repeat domain-containing protein n=1 Tax=Candidatus Dojkabacteria bacterium TaxID=2099670 RepID=A0A3M0YYZ9_9BACT|nr:MAG: hypothetical protein D6810_01330 [Candidatus Dojkabacteria bacterium]
MNKLKLAVVSLLSISIVLVLFILNNENKKGAVLINLEENEAPTSAPTQEIIFDPNLSKLDLVKFSYVSIREDDTLELIDKLGTSVIINLDRKLWQSASWSPSGVLLAVKGITKDQVYDLYIFDLIKKKWKKATDFANQKSGVQDFFWIGSKRIFFIQGKHDDSWLHYYDHESGEILKLEKTNGTITNVSPNRKYFVIRNQNEKYEVFDSMGKRIVTLGDFYDSLDTSVRYKVESVISINDEGRIILKFKENLYGKTEVGASLASKIDLPNADYQVVCSPSQEEVLLLEESSSLIKLYLFNSKRESLKLLSYLENKRLDKTHKAECFANGNIILATEGHINKWYEFRSDRTSFTELNFIKNSKYVRAFD